MCTRCDRAVLQWTLDPETALQVHGRRGLVWEVRVFKFIAESEAEPTADKEKEEPKSKTQTVVYFFTFCQTFCIKTTTFVL